MCCYVVIQIEFSSMKNKTNLLPRESLHFGNFEVLHLTVESPTTGDISTYFVIII
jgi:hypothetical protein